MCSFISIKFLYLKFQPNFELSHLLQFEWFCNSITFFAKFPEIFANALNFI